MQKERELLFVLNSLAVGGSEVKVVRTVNALVGSGVRAQIAYLGFPETLRSQVHSDVIVTNLRRRGKYSVRTLWRLRELMGNRAMVVIAVNLYPLLYVLPAVRLQGGARSTAVCLINTAEVEDVGTAWQQRLFVASLRRCDRLVFGCAAQLETWCEGYGLPRDRSVFAYNGVDSQYFCPPLTTSIGQAFRESLGLPDNAFVIGGVGRLDSEKNFGLAIEALACLRASGREAYLLLVGQGPERQRLESLAERIGVGANVKFAGALRDVRPAFAGMSAFVLPSSRVETFSNAALEAMAMGLPPVLSDVGGACEMIDDGKSGFLFPVDDVGRLEQLLARLFDSEHLRLAVGRAARERVISNFRFSDMVDFYRSLARS